VFDGVTPLARQFDLDRRGADPVEIDCFLKNGDAVLSENWLYQYHPF